MSVKGGGNERESGEVASISRIMGYRMAGARGGSVHTLLILTGCDINMRKGAPANGGRTDCWARFCRFPNGVRELDVSKKKQVWLLMLQFQFSLN